MTYPIAIWLAGAIVNVAMNAGSVILTNAQPISTQMNMWSN